MTTKFIFCLLASALFPFQACTRPCFENRKVIDFESEKDLDLFGWKCRSKFSISSEYKSHGTKSLKMEFYPTARVGFSTSHFHHRWDLSHTFVFTVYNPNRKCQTLYIKISDNLTKGNRMCSFIKEITVNPGENKIVLPMSELHDCLSRRLNLNFIKGFYVFMKDIPTRTVLYFDYFHLI